MQSNKQETKDGKTRVDRRRTRFCAIRTLGAIIGGVIGAIFDNSKEAQPPFGKSQQTNTVQGDFVVSLLVLVAAEMKADGKVVKSEYDYVKAQVKLRSITPPSPQGLKIDEMRLNLNSKYAGLI